MSIQDAQRRAAMIRKQASEDADPNLPKFKQVESRPVAMPAVPSLPVSPLPLFALPIMQLPPINVGVDNFSNFTRKGGQVPQRRVIPPAGL